MIKLVSTALALSVCFAFVLSGCAGVDTSEEETNVLDDTDESVAIDGPEADPEAIYRCCEFLHGKCILKVSYPQQCP